MPKFKFFKKIMRYFVYLLVYRSGELISRFVRLSDTLGEDFYASDLESFFIENRMLSDAKLMPSIIRSSLRDSGQDSD